MNSGREAEMDLHLCLETSLENPFPQHRANTIEASAVERVVEFDCCAQHGRHRRRRPVVVVWPAERHEDFRFETIDHKALKFDEYRSGGTRR